MVARRLLGVLIIRLTTVEVAMIMAVVEAVVDTLVVAVVEAAMVVATGVVTEVVAAIEVTVAAVVTMVIVEVADTLKKVIKKDTITLFRPTVELDLKEVHTAALVLKGAHAEAVVPVAEMVILVVVAVAGLTVDHIGTLLVSPELPAEVMTIAMAATVVTAVDTEVMDMEATAADTEITDMEGMVVAMADEDMVAAMVVVITAVMMVATADEVWVVVVEAVEEAEAVVDMGARAIGTKARKRTQTPISKCLSGAFIVTQPPKSFKNTSNNLAQSNTARLKLTPQRAKVGVLDSLSMRIRMVLIM